MDRLLAASVEHLLATPECLKLRYFFLIPGIEIAMPGTLSCSSVRIMSRTSASVCFVSGGDILVEHHVVDRHPHLVQRARVRVEYVCACDI